MDNFGEQKCRRKIRGRGGKTEGQVEGLQTSLHSQGVFKLPFKLG